MTISSVEAINMPRDLTERKSIMIPPILMTVFFGSKRYIPKN